MELKPESVIQHVANKLKHCLHFAAPDVLRKNHTKHIATDLYLQDLQLKHESFLSYKGYIPYFSIAQKQPRAGIWPE